MSSQPKKSDGGAGGQEEGAVTASVESIASGQMKGPGIGPGNQGVRSNSVLCNYFGLPALLFTITPCDE